MTNDGQPTVYVVQLDKNKDLSDAKRYGKLQAVFGVVRKPYEPMAMVRRARKVLENWKPGDYLLMVGDPALCTVCGALISEREATLNILSWDRNSFEYLPLTWNLEVLDHNLDNSEHQDD